MPKNSAGSWDGVSLENLYRRLFQQTTPEDFDPTIPEEFTQQGRQSSRNTRTYTTYGAYEDPIGLAD